MSLPKKHVIGILYDNLKRRKTVLPMSRRALTRWAKGLNLPRGGETVIYTGHMYQLIPKIAAMATAMARFENSWIRIFMGIGRWINKFINLSRFIGRPKKKDVYAYDRVLRNIAKLLKAAKVNFGYLYEKELYSGALLYDQGMDNVVKLQARRVLKMFRENGVRKVITVDPHTTHMLRSVYPMLLPEFDIEVISYLELLAEKGLPKGHSTNESMTIHDSCVYARYEEIIEQPRRLLDMVGVAVHEPEMKGKLTQCCGGPIESLMTGRAHEVALKRAKQLSSFESSIIVMCPICMVNLTGASLGTGIEYKDIADVLAANLLETPQNEQNKVKDGEEANQQEPAA